ncbi:hypothetical protein PIN31115_04511 [Pandoraea iniqua]|uniref:Uncharacterized protein n=1 Tax=Pandoraea iniqua TaxID=2508288 RepID=A0A5E4YIC8_9BURK|nr:YscO family type III secretion system apparatus protein [Pandoraea iniqua]VVE48252.1 hypothetical protein PIN31115_04511 [Pandoraea iniqua]
MLAQLLSIKHHRETLAERAVARSRTAQLEASQRLKAEQSTLVELKRVHSEREEHLFHELCGRIVKVAAIEDVRAAVSHMRDSQERQVHTIDECESRLGQCDAQLGNDREQLLRATKTVEKYEQWLAQIDEDNSIQTQRCEDNELDDITSSLPRRDVTSL